jgi:hypothetical protein
VSKGKEGAMVAILDVGLFVPWGSKWASSRNFSCDTGSIDTAKIYDLDNENGTVSAHSITKR